MIQHYAQFCVCYATVCCTVCFTGNRFCVMNNVVPPPLSAKVANVLSCSFKQLVHLPCSLSKVTFSFRTVLRLFVNIIVNFSKKHPVLCLKKSWFLLNKSSQVSLTRSSRKMCLYKYMVKSVIMHVPAFLNSKYGNFISRIFFFKKTCFINWPYLSTTPARNVLNLSNIRPALLPQLTTI